MWLGARRAGTEQRMMPLEEIGWSWNRRTGEGSVWGAEHARQVARRNTEECFKARSSGDGVIAGLGER